MRIRKIAHILILPLFSIIVGCSAGQDLPSSSSADSFDMGYSEAPFPPAYEMSGQEEKSDYSLTDAYNAAFNTQIEPPPTMDEGSLLEVISSNITIDKGDQLSNCTAGMSITDGTTEYVVTSGHCGKDEEKILISNKDIGAHFQHIKTKTESDGSDWGIFPYDDFNNYVGIESGGLSGFMSLDRVVSPEVGMRVCSFGYKSGWRCGTITEVVDDNIFYTNFVSRSGDSGGVVIAGNNIVGITDAHGTDEKGRVVRTKVTRADTIIRTSGMELSPQRSGTD